MPLSDTTVLAVVRPGPVAGIQSWSSIKKTEKYDLVSFLGNRTMFLRVFPLLFPLRGYGLFFLALEAGLPMSAVVRYRRKMRQCAAAAAV